MHVDERVVTGEKPKGRQGFASMDAERVKAIASKGGHAVQKLGLAHRWTKRSASLAGQKGAAARKARKQQAA